MIEFLEPLILGTVLGAAGGIIATTISFGVVWLVLTIDRAVRK